MKRRGGIGRQEAPLRNNF
ncbi:Protein of unknown function [Thermobacillus xylanilyticus]|uniref:Uncharacterized protein n=1 Tax=Thermobacillus xylanilyticus TaxID=76633 RepID=A0ABM8V6F5_THEXY|nr:Protein of unknown function [Thermobacillus xylanilyticus]